MISNLPDPSALAAGALETVFDCDPPDSGSDERTVARRIAVILNLNDSYGSAETRTTWPRPATSSSARRDVRRADGGAWMHGAARAGRV